MAAEVLAESGASVDVYEAMPTLGRKFLRAGLGGLNITHSEPFDAFCSRYGDRETLIRTYLEAFTPDALQEWVHGLGIETFTGSSGRVFPKEMKAAPLLRAWIHRLRHSGVRFHHKHQWLGFNADDSLSLNTPDGVRAVKVEATILALGGASWPQLGSTGAWVPWLEERGVRVEPWKSANCGFDVTWSQHLKEKFAGTPLKAVSLTFTNLDGKTETRKGELLISEYGVEGSLIYHFSRQIREKLDKDGQSSFTLDLAPGKSSQRVLQELSRPRGSRSISRHLQTCLGNDALKRALLYENLTKEQFSDTENLAKCIKALPITVIRTRPIDEVISSAGGVSFDSVNEDLMLKAIPGVFACGEMLDWEAPTGGYLLTACFGTGRWAGIGAARWLAERKSSGQ